MKYKKLSYEQLEQYQHELLIVQHKYTHIRKVLLKEEEKEIAEIISRFRTN